ncbi:MAG: arylsulfatase, partial [Planctomycetales bacterium 12-60-4]
MRRSIHIFLAACCSLCVGAMLDNVAGAAECPNILILFADDLGYSDLGCYGGEIETPNLDRLAAEGLRFTQFYNTARCWPSRAALLTGYYAQQVRRDTLPGIPSGSRGVRPPWAPLLPEMLASFGYHSYHSGKWHIDGPRLPAGFEHSYSLEDQNRFFNPRQHLEDDKPLPPIAKGSDYYATIGIADHAIRCLQDHARNHPGAPFFSYVV